MARIPHRPACIFGSSESRQHKKTDPNLTDEQWKEILRDISPIHKWRDPLGQNDKPTEGTKIRESIVLVIRGELLKEPAVIMPHKAMANLNGDIDPTKEELNSTLAEENPRATR